MGYCITETERPQEPSGGCHRLSPATQPTPAIWLYIDSLADP